MLRPSLPRFVLAGALLHLALYGRGSTGGFTFDDRKIVLEDPAVSGRTPLASVLSREYFPKSRREEGIAYRPLTLLSLGADVRLFGPSARAMRFENLLLAGIGAGLFAGLTAALGAPSVVAWGTLLLLCCHPVRSEAVLSVVGRSELLAFGLVVGALVAALRALRGSATAAALSALLVALAFFAKENAFAAPALLALVAVAAGRSAPVSRRGALVLFLGWGLALAGAFAVRHAVLGGFTTGPLAVFDPFDNLLAGLPPGDRIRGALALLPLAAARLVWPATLVADYGSAAFSTGALLAPVAVLSGAALLLLAVALAALLLARGSLAGVGIAFALIVHLPFANLIFPTGTAFAERLLYASAAGVVLALVAALARAPKRLGLAAGASLALLGAVRIEARIPEWRDDRALFTSVVRDVPSNGRAWFDLGLLALSAGDAGSARTALASAVRADARLVPAARELLAHARTIGNARAAAAIEAALVGR